MTESDRIYRLDTLLGRIYRSEAISGPKVARFIVQKPYLVRKRMDLLFSGHYRIESVQIYHLEAISIRKMARFNI